MRLFTWLTLAAWVLLSGCAHRVPDPATYHYKGEAQFYEGWYTRATDPATGETFSLLYGISNPGGGEVPGTGYVIALNGAASAQIYQEVPLQQVHATRGEFDVDIGGNRVRRDHASGEISDGVNRCRWSLDFSSRQVWEDPPHNSPMGFALALPGVETWWHIVHLNATVSGTLTWNDRTLTLEAVPGYMEKNWGKVFPRDWIWAQANTFDRPQASFSMAGGEVPLPVPVVRVRSYVLGYHDGEEFHAFATHHGARIRSESTAGTWQVEARTLRRKLVMSARCDPGTLVTLAGPTEEGVGPVALESLLGEMQVQLYQRHRGRWVLDHTSHARWAGVEVGGLHHVEAAEQRRAAAAQGGQALTP